jgi:lipid A 4'-phosphatase
MTATATQSEFDQPDSGSPFRRRALKRRGWILAAVQMAVLVLVTVLLERFDVDRRLAAHFYRADDGWYLSKSPLWVWLYAYGTIPGLMLTLGALIACLAGFYVPYLRSWRKPCLLVVLTAMIAAGLLVNAVLKQYWGRPRPSQTVELGGKWDYRPIFPPGPPGKGASFPCGHCTMGFVFLAMAGFYRQNKALAVSGVAAGMVLGVLLSVGRMVQGAHFLSDAIWSLGIVAMTASIVYMYLAPISLEDKRVSGPPMSRSSRIWITATAVIGALILAGGFFTRRPYHTTKDYLLDLDQAVQVVDIRINANPERVAVRYGDQPAGGLLQVDVHGFGWMNFDYHLGFDTHTEGRTLYAVVDVKARSYFAELDHALTLTLPRNTDHRLAVRVNDRLLDGIRP